MHIVRIGAEATELRPAEEIGAKAANLARMAALGLPVPPAFVLPVKLCADIIAGHAHAERHLSDGLKEGIAFLESATGRRFGCRCWSRCARAPPDRCRACSTPCSMSAARRMPCTA
ncbi:hypothetical protein ACVME8_001605 [Bradyrhizobium diazoefficiens]